MNVARAIQEALEEQCHRDSVKMWMVSKLGWDQSRSFEDQFHDRFLEEIAKVRAARG